MATNNMRNIFPTSLSRIPNQPLSPYHLTERWTSPTVLT
jgi:hypothetical protein